MKAIPLLSSLIVLILSPTAVAGGAKPKVDKKGALLYETCKACHGADGQGNGAIDAPPIAGQPQWYLERSLYKFKHGIRGAHHKDVAGLKMRPMGRQLKDNQQIKSVAKYVASLKKPEPSHRLHGDPEAGKNLYMACMACHGAQAEGNEIMKAPPLSGLPDWYISNQLDKFKEGIRGAHSKDIEGASMRPMAMMLADRTAMDNIAAYIASLHLPQGPKSEHEDSHQH